MNRVFSIDEAQAGIRLDRVLPALLEPLTRSHIQKLIEESHVLVNGESTRGNRKLKIGDLISVVLPEPKEAAIEAEAIPLNILYEDKDVILIDKPKGMVVHPAAGHSGGTLVNALMYHCRNQLSGINGVLRPGIVHRIDRDTTGVIIACKNDAAHQAIAAQLKEHSITRRYRAVVQGVLKEEHGTVDAPIARDPRERKKMKAGVAGGKRAVTHYRVLQRYRNASYIECCLETGRTHQIRVHMAYIGHPLLGDTVYGSEKNPYHLEGQALHAIILGFCHPTSGKYMEFSAPLPDYFQQLLKKLPQ